MKTKQKHTGIINLIISLLIAAGMFVLFRLLTGFIYLTNDDMYLQAIVSGELSGTPDAHMIYSNYILGLILSLLYRLIPAIPWYGIYLVGVCFVCEWIILYRCLSGCRKICTKAAVSVLFFILSFCAIFRHIAMIQYTVVAAIAGGTAVFYALTIDIQSDKKRLIREYIVVAALALVSLIIRDKVFFMMVPFAACGWLGKWITDKNKSKAKNIRYVALLAGIVCLMLLVCGADRLAYRIGSDSSEWQEYFRYNKAREQIMDYNSFPDYDSNREFYDELGISREAYEGVSKYYLTLPQKNLNSETMPIIADKAIAVSRAGQTFKEHITGVIRSFVGCNINYSDRPMNIVVYGMWMCLAVTVVLLKNKSMLLQLVLLFVTRMGMWIYIIRQGRYPDRITQGLYFVELVMLIAIFILNGKDIADKGLSKKICMWGAFVITGAISLYIGIPKAIAVKGENAGKLFFGTSYQQLKEYCAGNKDNIYLADMNSVSHFSASVFKSAVENDEICDNLLPMGGWMNVSPLITDSLGRYAVKDITKDLVDNEHVYFVFMESEATPEQYLTDFYRSELKDSNVGLKRTDILNTDAGINYIIYRLESIQ